MDESGEAYLFPASLFAPIVLRGKARNAILAASTEDEMDLVAARRALAEKGPNVPWKKLKAELGL